MSDEKFLKTPIYVISVIVGVLRQYFGTPGRIATEESSYLWTENPGEAQVYIAQDFNENRSVVGKRPSILVGFPNLTMEQKAIGDFMSMTPGPDSEVRNFDVVRGQIRLRCVSSSALSSVELATEVRYFMSVFRHQIACKYGFDLLRPGGMVGPIKIEEYKDYWTTDVFCDIMYQENWGVFVEGLRIKSINLQLDIENG